MIATSSQGCDYMRIQQQHFQFSFKLDHVNKEYWNAYYCIPEGEKLRLYLHNFIYWVKSAFTSYKNQKEKSRRTYD